MNTIKTNHMWACIDGQEIEGKDPARHWRSSVGGMEPRHALNANAIRIMNAWPLRV